MSSNKVDSFAEVEHLQPLTKLQTLYLEHNPLASDYEYRIKLARIIPSLTQIDALRRF